jgi:hypothetical protein
LSFVTWNDPDHSGGWSSYASILAPAKLPLGVVATGLLDNAFTMTVAGGTMPATVAVSATDGSATLVYQVDRTNGIVTVNPIDITTSSGLADLTNGLTAGAPVKVYGIPQANSTLKAYILAYFTGDMPSE